MDRIKTGIPGFDKLVGGGLPQGKIILLSGTPGTCKTIFALQYIYMGACDFNEKGLFISFEEREENLKNQARQFGWDFAALEKKNMVKLISIPPKNLKESTARDIIELAKKLKVKRVVVDSLSALSINSPSTYSKETELTDISIKRFMYRFINDMRDMDGATTILISQTEDNELSRDGVSEFVCDGIILIKYESLGGDYSRNLNIRKMRETDNDEDIHPLEVGKKGIIVHQLK